ncbi:hypothetical protein PRNP1_009585 [Phytophthora ramorum]
MRLYIILLAAVFSQLATSGTLASSSHRVPTSSITSLDAEHKFPANYFTVDGRRSLRASKSIDDEERVIPAISKWMKTTFWLNAGKSDEHVRKTLGLEGLSGAALKASPNYAYYEHFLYALEGRKLDDMLSREVSTQSVWNENKLDDILAAQLKDSDGFKTYARYVTMYDDKMISLRNKDKDVNLEFGGSTAEKNAKVEIWISAERPSWYVRKVLNLDVRSKNARQGSENYKYYKNFLHGIEGRKMDRWLSAGVTTHQVWGFYQLDEMSYTLLKKRSSLMSYVRYATMYDDEMFKLSSSGKEVKIGSEASPAEINIKVEIWASANRPKEYVEKILGLEKSALTTSPNYPYYERFLQLLAKEAN